MFGFIKDFTKNNELTRDVFDYKTIMLSNTQIVIQGVVGLQLVQETEIISKTPNGEIAVIGENLAIDELNNCIVSIKGVIKKIEVTQI